MKILNKVFLLATVVVLPLSTASAGCKWYIPPHLCHAIETAEEIGLPVPSIVPTPFGPLPVSDEVCIPHIEAAIEFGDRFDIYTVPSECREEVDELLGNLNQFIDPFDLLPDSLSYDDMIDHAELTADRLNDAVRKIREQHIKNLETIREQFQNDLETLQELEAGLRDELRKKMRELRDKLAKHRDQIRETLSEIRDLHQDLREEHLSSLIDLRESLRELKEDLLREKLEGAEELAEIVQSIFDEVAEVVLEIQGNNSLVTLPTNTDTDSSSSECSNALNVRLELYGNSKTSGALKWDYKRWPAEGYHYSYNVMINGRFMPFAGDFSSVEVSLEQVNRYSGINVSDLRDVEWSVVGLLGERPGLDVPSIANCRVDTETVTTPTDVSSVTDGDGFSDNGNILESCDSRFNLQVHDWGDTFLTWNYNDFRTSNVENGFVRFEVMVDTRIGSGISSEVVATVDAASYNLGRLSNLEDYNFYVTPIRADGTRDREQAVYNSCK